MGERSPFPWFHDPDRLIRWYGRPCMVLLLDQQSSHLLRNKMLDVRETDEGPRLLPRSLTSFAHRFG